MHAYNPSRQGRGKFWDPKFEPRLGSLVTYWDPASKQLLKKGLMIQLSVKTPGSIPQFCNKIIKNKKQKISNMFPLPTENEKECMYFLKIEFT